MRMKVWRFRVDNVRFELEGVLLPSFRDPGV